MVIYFWPTVYLNQQKLRLDWNCLAYIMWREEYAITLNIVKEVLFGTSEMYITCNNVNVLIHTLLGGIAVVVKSQPIKLTHKSNKFILISRVVIVRLGQIGRVAVDGKSRENIIIATCFCFHYFYHFRLILITSPVFFVFFIISDMEVGPAWIVFI